MPEVELVLEYPWLLLLVLAAAAASVLVYRTTTPPVGGARRVLLAVLRGAVLALLLFLIAEPLLRLLVTSVRPPAVAVLVDNSQSMRLADGPVERRAVLDSLLRGGLLGSLPGSVRSYTFDAALAPLPDGALPAYDGDVTDIAGALEALARDREPVDAAILFTDGVHTAGRAPVYVAARLGLPLVTVGVGDSAEQRDLVLVRVLANELVYEGVPSPVDITVRSSGFGGERVTVSLRDGARELAAAALLLEEGTREYGVRLEYTPPEEGSRRLTAAVSGLEGELTAENNEQSFSVRVLQSRLRILILAGVPSPDATAVRLSLSEDERFEVRLLTARRGGGWYGERGWDADSADCIVLVEFPSADVPRGEVERLRDAVRARDMPVLSVGGPSVDPARLRLLDDVLPVTLELPSALERLTQVRPLAGQRTHPLVSIGDEGDWGVWELLPPVFATMSVVRPRDGAMVLAEARPNAGGDGAPFLVARRSGLRASVALLGHALWRWRLMGQASPRTADFHARWFATAVVWLTTREETRPVRVRPVREFFRQGEPVVFAGEVYDGLRRPVDNARVTVTVRQAEQSLRTELQPVGNGRYQGELYGLAEGEARFEASALEAGTLLGTDSGRVTIGGTAVEYQTTRMDPATLREMAAVSGGRYLGAAQSDRLPDVLEALPSYRPRTEVRSQSLALWDWPAAALVLILLLALEWAVRKRSGML